MTYPKHFTYKREAADHAVSGRYYPMDISKLYSEYDEYDERVLIELSSDTYEYTVTKLSEIEKREIYYSMKKQIKELNDKYDYLHDGVLGLIDED
jgi:hypothetical protein